ncbi:hypothetical protein GG344DRAFT_70278 [Lentinula edodes]|nr:hypothetical protein GG344DRAFT_70278 [Lentinula edodes]
MDNHHHEIDPTQQKTLIRRIFTMIAVWYLIFTFALVPSILAAAVPSPATLDLGCSYHPLSKPHPSFEKVLLQKSTLLEAAMTELGINLPDSELRKAMLVYGFIGKPDPTWAQYDFKVEFLMSVGKGEDDKGEWMDCKGRVGYIYHEGEMKVTGSILNPEGKRIVRLRKGKIFHKSLPQDLGTESHNPAETGGKIESENSAPMKQMTVKVLDGGLNVNPRELEPSAQPGTDDQRR